jgi:hypothetical protein
MTKKDAAARLLSVVKLMRDSLAGDEDADLWILLLESIAYDLDVPTYSRLAEYVEGPTRKVKLRRLIEHPATPQPEREAALAALGRLR